MKSNLKCIVILLGVVLWSVTVSAAELRMPAIFSAEMVLQRDKPVPVWGWADVGTEVTVEFAGQKKSAMVTGTNHEWRVTLKSMKANSKPQVMLVTSSIGNPASPGAMLGHSQQLEIKNILVGDVWLCSGQSNMEMTVGPWGLFSGCQNYEVEIKESNNPLIRQFDVARGTSFDPQADCGSGSKWSIAGPDTTRRFSATGYFFAREVQRKQGIPIAIINASLGAVSIYTFISKEALMSVEPVREAAFKRIEDFKSYPARYEQYKKVDYAAWEEKIGRKASDSPGDDNVWASILTDTSGWKKIQVPGNFAENAGYSNGGVIWLRREVELEGDNRPLRLEFPFAGHAATAYFNGVKIGDVNFSKRSNCYALDVPKKVAQGVKKATIALRVHAYDGKEGIVGKADMVRISRNNGADSIPMAGEWLCKAEAEFCPMPRDAGKAPRPPKSPGWQYYMPTTEFNGMINPIIPYGIKGALWYQGESNAGPGCGEPYRLLLKALVSDWRVRWNMGDFPFYICQLPGNGKRLENPDESGWAELREAQTKAMELPGVYVANLIDTCEDGDLHPNKQEVGRRLALIAMANVYGDRAVVPYGPMYESMRVEDGKAMIKFKHADDGLVAQKLPATYKVNVGKPELGEKLLVLPRPGSEVQGFAICGADHQWVWADAKIEGSTGIVWSDKVAKPVAVRYAWADHPVCNLYNKAGLPAFPFRTDRFETAGK